MARRTALVAPTVRSGKEGVVKANFSPRASMCGILFCLERAARGQDETWGSLFASLRAANAARGWLHVFFFSLRE